MCQIHWTNPFLTNTIIVAFHQPRKLCHCSHYSRRFICLRRFDSLHFREGPGEHEWNLLQSISAGGSGNDKLEGDGRRNKLKATASPWHAWWDGVWRMLRRNEITVLQVSSTFVCMGAQARRYNIRVMTWSGGLGAATRPSATKTGHSLRAECVRRRRRSTCPGPTFFILDFHGGCWLSKSITPSLTAVPSPPIKTV